MTLRLCGASAVAVYHWPGHESMPVCEECLEIMRTIAWQGFNFRLLTDKAPDGATCQQMRRGNFLYGSGT